MFFNLRNRVWGIVHKTMHIIYPCPKPKNFFCSSRAFCCHLQNYCNSLTETRDRKRTSWVLLTKTQLWLATNLIIGLDPFFSSFLQWFREPNGAHIFNVSEKESGMTGICPSPSNASTAAAGSRAGESSLTAMHSWEESIRHRVSFIYSVLS